MQLYKFSELLEESQQKAIIDYRNGWLETHEIDDVDSENETKVLLLDLDDNYFYEENGEFVGFRE